MIGEKNKTFFLLLDCAFALTLVIAALWVMALVSAMILSTFFGVSLSDIGWSVGTNSIVLDCTTR